MRHKVRIKKLGRTKSHRKSTLINLSKSLIKYERIKTTLAKAKYLRPFIERIIHRAKVNNLHNKRLILSKIQDHYLTNKLFEKISVRYLDRPGGYTRIYKLENPRIGDKAKLALIELVEGKEKKSNSDKIIKTKNLKKEK